MKRLFFFVLTCFIALSLSAQDYVDLGLYSGTLWNSVNEKGLYTFDEATAKYTYQMPSFRQWVELRLLCEWEWIETGYKVIGPNGNFIILPNDGMRNCDGEIDMVGDDGFTGADDNSFMKMYFEDGYKAMEKASSAYQFTLRIVQSGK